MNIRVVVLLLAIAVQPALAREADKNAEATIAARAALLQTAGRGSNITSNNQQYQILTDVRAVEKNSQEEPQQTLTRMGGGKLIETNGDYSFVGCTVAPGFDFADFELAHGAILQTEYPDHSALIERLCR